MLSADCLLPPELTSPRQGRRFAVATLEGWGLAHVAETVMLLVTELVTNAVLHAATPIRLRLAVDAGTLLIEVADDSARAPGRRHYSPEATTGRGLGLVEQLSRAWGIRPARVGKAVWCEVEVGRSPGARVDRTASHRADAGRRVPPPRGRATPVRAGELAQLRRSA